MHDIPNALHFAVLLNSKKEPIGPVFCNARNIFAATRGPLWSRQLYGNDEHSIHAEARAAQRVFSRTTTRTKKSRKNAERSTVGKAYSIIVCRFSRSGELRLSLPCRTCVSILARCGLKTVIYSTGDTGKQWARASISSLLFS